MIRGTVPFAVFLLAFVAGSVSAQAPPSKSLRPELTDAIRFTIVEVRIEGNSLVPANALLEAVKPYLGTGKRVEDLNGGRLRGV